MKYVILSVAAICLAVLILSPTPAALAAEDEVPGKDYRGGQQYVPPPGSDWNYCPYCGRGFHHGRGGRRGPGMMGPGFYYHHGYHRDGRRYEAPLTLDDAKNLLMDMVKSGRNPNLKLGQVKEKDGYFEATVVTKKSEDVVDKLRLDKDSGEIWSVYE